MRNTKKLNYGVQMASPQKAYACPSCGVDLAIDLNVLRKKLEMKA